MIFYLAFKLEDKSIFGISLKRFRVLIGVSPRDKNIYKGMIFLVVVIYSLFIIISFMVLFNYYSSF